MSEWCDCCSRIIENGARRPPTEALYAWWTPTGYRFPLCASCCALWRLNAVDDPDLEPAKLHSIGATP